MNTSTPAARWRRARWLLAAVALVAAEAACRPPGPPATRVVERLIDVGDHAQSSAVVFYDTVEVERWDFTVHEDVAAWTPERIDTTFQLTDEDGLVIETTSNDPSIFRPVDLDAERVDAIRVTQSGLTGDDYMQLFWAGPGEIFSDERTLGCVAKDMDGSLVPSYTLRLRGRPGWRGPVSTLRLDPTSLPGRRQVVHSISALDLVPSAARLAEVAARPWRVDVHGDVRTAVLTPPRHPFTRRVTIPEQASLRFAHALEPGLTEPVTFRIVLARPGAGERVLHEQTLEPCSTAAACAWFEGEIDLAELAGATVDLRFETEAASALDLFEGFPAWATLEVARWTTDRRPPNVVLIIVDTLRADRLSLYGHDRPTSTRLEAWAAGRAVVFDTVVAPAPWTLPSHASIFTGLGALRHGANTGDPMPASLTTLAEILRAEGYATHAVTGGAFLTEPYGLMQGFDDYRYFYPPVVDPARAADDLVAGVDRAVAWLEGTTDRPFFLLFHTYEPHTPYRAREPFFSAFHNPRPGEPLPPVDTLHIPEKRARGYEVTAALQAHFDGPEPGTRRVPDEHFDMVRALYDSGVAFADLHVGRLLDRIDALGLRQNTVVVVTSDHGESLGERGRADHKSLEDWELLVPLVIAAPDLERFADRRIGTQVRLIDLMPTILELVDVKVPPELDGRSLVGLVERPGRRHPADAWSYASSSNFGISLRRSDRLKYVFNNSAWRPIHGREHLYRLDRDPLTLNDVAAVDPLTPELRATTTDFFERRAGGLRVRFVNREPVPMEGHLKGHIVEPLRVKTFDLPTEDIEWRYQMVNFTLPAGETVTFFVEGNPFGDLYVTARSGVGCEAPSELKKVLRLESLREPWRAILSDGRWTEGQAPPAADHSHVEAWLHGRPPEATAPADLDPQQRELLRKLGYVQ